MPELVSKPVHYELGTSKDFHGCCSRNLTPGSYWGILTSSAADAAGHAACFFHRASVYYTWFEACHLQAVKLFLTVNSGKCQLLLLSHVVCVSSEEKHWRTTCHPLPVVNVPVCPPVFIWTVLSRWKITKHGAVWDCVRLTFSGSTSLLFVVVVVLLSRSCRRRKRQKCQVSSIKEQKKRSALGDCDKHKKWMVQAKFVTVEHGVSRHRLLPGSSLAGTCRRRHVWYPCIKRIIFLP